MDGTNFHGVFLALSYCNLIEICHEITLNILWKSSWTLPMKNSWIVHYVLSLNFSWQCYSHLIQAAKRCAAHNLCCYLSVSLNRLRCCVLIISIIIGKVEVSAMLYFQLFGIIYLVTFVLIAIETFDQSLEGMITESGDCLICLLWLYEMTG